MKVADKVRHVHSNDQTLQWIMRVIGAILTLASCFLLTSDYFTSAMAIWFFRVSAGLGVATIITSFVPETPQTSFDYAPAQPVRTSQEQYGKRLSK